MTDLTNTTLLNLLSNALFGTPIEIPDDVDWQEVYQESVAQSVSALAFSILNKEILPNDVSTVWEENTYQIMMSNMQVDADHAKLHEILSSSKIPYVILKGNVSASYYPDPMLRAMGDVDFLIEKKDIGKVDLLLRKNGFEAQQSNHECERAYHKGISIWELHWEVNGVPGGEVGKTIHIYLKDMIEKAEPATLTNGEYLSPTPFHHGLVMLLHVARHMITGGIGLRHLCDWAVFIDRIGDKFPELFEDKLKNIGLWRFAQLLTQLSVVYLKCPEQNWMGELEFDLLDALKDDLFAAGNFGHKDSNRADEAKFITSRRKGGVNDDSAVKQSILSANEIVRKHWKFADKVPVVYPVGWAFFGGRYAIRAAVGKREKKDVKTLTKTARERKKLYKQIDLFGTEGKILTK